MSMFGDQISELMEENARLKTRIAELVQENVEDRRSAQHEHDRLKAELAAVVKLLAAVYDQCGNHAEAKRRHALTPGLRDAIRDHLAALTQAEPRPTPGAGDDGEPVTEEWLQVTIDTSSTRVWALWVAARDFLPKPTRGDVRRLCAALGITLKETE